MKWIVVLSIFICGQSFAQSSGLDLGTATSTIEIDDVNPSQKEPGTGIRVGLLAPVLTASSSRLHDVNDSFGVGWALATSPICLLST
jgi:hypothetical protein